MLPFVQDREHGNLAGGQGTLMTAGYMVFMQGETTAQGLSSGLGCGREKQRGRDFISCPCSMCRRLDRALVLALAQKAMRKLDISILAAIRQEQHQCDLILLNN